MSSFLILCLCSTILATLLTTRLIYKLWWCPISMERKLRAQGLKGPSYRSIHGNNKEIVRMRDEATKSPCELWQHDLFPRILPHVHTWIQSYGDNFFNWDGPQADLVVTEPELVKEILNNKDGVYRKFKVSGHAKKYLGDGLVVSEGEKWSRLRKVANHAFHGECLKEMFSDMVSCADEMLKKWAKHEAAGKEIEVTTEFKVLTSEVIARTAFGSSYVEGRNIFKVLSNLRVLLAKNHYKTKFFGLERIWNFKEEMESHKIEQSMRDSIISMVRKREDAVKTGKVDGYGNDFLGSLLRVHHSPDPATRISLDNIVDECKVFYNAGHGTTSTMLPWIVVLLSTYPEWQEKAREEVLSVCARENPTPEGITRLRVLTMIVNEALRIYSPVLNLKRRVARKTKLGKYDLPANIDVDIPPLALHMNSKIWGDDAHLFKPERFSEGLAKATNGNPVAFLTFSYGPRVCVGSAFAMNEIKIVLVMILQRYRFTLSPTYVHSPYQFLMVTARYGVPIILHPL